MPPGQLFFLQVKSWTARTYSDPRIPSCSFPARVRTETLSWCTGQSTSKTPSTQSGPSSLCRSVPSATATSTGASRFEIFSVSLVATLRDLLSISYSILYCCTLVYIRNNGTRHSIHNLQVECFDYNRNGNHSLIGEFYVTVRSLQMGPGEQNVYETINPKKKLVSF